MGDRGRARGAPRCAIPDGGRDVATVDLRPDAASRGDACRRVVLIGPRGMSFPLHATGRRRVVGAITRLRCERRRGAGVAGLRRRSPYGGEGEERFGAWGCGDGFVATGKEGAAASHDPPRGERGEPPSDLRDLGLPPLLPPGARANLTEERLAREGFAVRPELTWTAGSNGKGGPEMILEEGCHRIDLFAVEPHGRDTGPSDAPARPRREPCGELTARSLRRT